MTREEIMERCEKLDHIWQAMKEGKKFKFGNGRFGFIEAIELFSPTPLRSEYGWWKTAKIIEPKRRVKGPVELMKTLIDSGYVCDDDGIWWHPSKQDFSPRMFQYCGKFISENIYVWEPEWTEEVME